MAIMYLSSTVPAGFWLPVPPDIDINKPGPVTGFAVRDIPAPVPAGNGYYFTVNTSHNLEFPQIILKINNISPFLFWFYNYKKIIRVSKERGGRENA
jgi:hypothetical protein